MEGGELDEAELVKEMMVSEGEGEGTGLGGAEKGDDGREWLGK